MKALRLLIPVSLLSLAAIAIAGTLGGGRGLPENAGAQSETDVQWVFSARDLISCRTPAHALRHLRPKFGSNVRIAACGSEVDQADARSFREPGKETRPLARFNGGLWCDGSCGAGQQCCDIKSYQQLVLNRWLPMERTTLEESVGMINVNPRVIPARDGGFIVADARKRQICIYSRAEVLEHHFGSYGKGLASFAISEPHGADMRGDVTVFDSVGGRLCRRSGPLTPLYNLTVLDGRHIVLTGRISLDHWSGNRNFFVKPLEQRNM